MKTKAWCVLSPKGKLVSYTVAPTKRDLIDLIDMRCFQSWSDLRGQGYKCVRVVISVDESATKEATK